MEPIFEREYTLTDLHCDRFGRLKPSALLFLVQEAAGGHCKLLQLDWDTLSKRGLFWAIIRHRLQITRLPSSGEVIRLQTWPMPTTRVAYPRSVVGYDSQGNELFRSISLWVLMDMQKRAMVLPAKSGVEVSGILRGNELPTPASLSPQLFSSLAQRRVCFTDLDLNGHMNNAKYLDWVSDLLPSQFHERHCIRDMTLGYLSEALEGDVLQLSWQTESDNTLCLEITRREDQTQHRVFSARIDYRKE